MSERVLVGPELDPKIKRGDQPKPRRISIGEHLDRLGDGRIQSVARYLFATTHAARPTKSTKASTRAIHGAVT